MTYDVNTLSAARLFEYRPDWTQGYEVTRGFLTDVITSRNATEQRRALRDVARVSARYVAVIEDDDLRDARHFLRARQNDPVAVPDFARHAATTGASLSGTTSLTVASPPAWLAAGSLAVLCGDTAELVQVSGVAGSTITLAGALDNTWPAGSTVRPALHGLLSGQMGSGRYRRGAHALDVQIACYPGGEPVEDEGAASDTFNGYEVFTFEPDWSGQPRLEYLWPVDQVDFGIGRTAQFRPIDVGRQLTEAAFSLDRDDAVALEQFFLRMKGRRGAFYLPSTEQDMVLAANTTATAYFDAAGTDIADDFGSLDFSANPTAVEIVQTSGTRTRKLITGITTSGGNSRIAFSGAVTLTVATTARISWMPLVRFAADEMTTRWLTPLTATIRTTFQGARA